MTNQERLRSAIEYLGISNKAFAEAIGVTRVYVSRLLTQAERKMSPQLAEIIENKFGISADWLLNEKGEMLSTFQRLPNLRDMQKKLAGELEQLNLDQINAVIAFSKLLKKEEKENENKNVQIKIEEYSKFLEWQAQQKKEK